jgi:PD-(D/E)XK nuclease superfamily
VWQLHQHFSNHLSAPLERKALNADIKKMHAEHADSDRLNDLSGRVIGCAFTVLNTYGVGFPEKVYANALAYQLRAAGFFVVQQCSVRVHYHDVLVGEYFTDLFQASGLRLCLLLNFAKPRLEIKRVVHGLRTTLNDLRVPRASASDLRLNLLVVQGDKARKVGAWTVACQRESHLLLPGRKRPHRRAPLEKP